MTLILIPKVRIVVSWVSADVDCCEIRTRYLTLYPYRQYQTEVVPNPYDPDCAAWLSILPLQRYFSEEFEFGDVVGLSRVALLRARRLVDIMEQSRTSLACRYS
jgi:hypothetical protein